ncbi:hypothetical protein KHQ82_02885 [Mycoplasmatota bacterium]|nr:hypothetical protein KHQ82_02885 [Mycoplasmatota bacterium]
MRKFFIIVVVGGITLYLFSYLIFTNYNISNDNIPKRIPFEDVEKITIVDYYAYSNGTRIYRVEPSQTDELIKYLKKLKYPLSYVEAGTAIISRFQVRLDIGEKHDILFDPVSGFIQYRNKNLEGKNFYYANFDREKYDLLIKEIINKVE